MPGTVISSRAGERSGKTWSSRPVARSPTIAVPSGSTASPVGTASPEATTFGSPASCPDSGFAGSPGAGTAGVSVGGPTSGGLPWGNGRNGPAGGYPPSPPPAGRPGGGGVPAVAAAGEQHGEKEHEDGEQTRPGSRRRPPHPDHSTCASRKPGS